jgi:hypothetical protein
VVAAHAQGARVQRVKMNPGSGFNHLAIPRSCHPTTISKKNENSFGYLQKYPFFILQQTMAKAATRNQTNQMTMLL